MLSRPNQFQRRHNIHLYAAYRTQCEYPCPNLLDLKYNQLRDYHRPNRYQFILDLFAWEWLCSMNSHSHYSYWSISCPFGQLRSYARHQHRWPVASKQRILACGTLRKSYSDNCQRVYRFKYGWSNMQGLQNSSKMFHHPLHLNNRLIVLFRLSIAHFSHSSHPTIQNYPTDFGVWQAECPRHQLSLLF